MLPATRRSAISGGFVTGTGSDTTHATVSTISPGNGQTGVPLNAQVVAVMNDRIDPTTVTNSSITVTPSGGSAIAGTVTLASDGVTLTFAPAAALTASTLYNVSVGGFKDVEGNTVTTFTSSFTTGTTSARIVHGAFDQPGQRSHRHLSHQPGHLHHEQPDQSGVGE